MKTQKPKVCVCIGLAILISNMMLFAEPMSTVFTYQGRLLDDNVAADGLYDFEFTLHYSDPNGLPSVKVITPFDDVQVTDGYFTVELDLESSFNGDARWLEIAVRPGESTDPNDYESLEPISEITSTPYAIYALKTRGLSVDEDLNVGIGTTTPAEELEVAGTVKADAFVGDGSDLTGILKVVNIDMHDVPRWSGTYLTEGSIYDDGTHITIGDTPGTYAEQLLSVKTDTLPASLYAVMMTEDPLPAPYVERFAVRAYTSGNSMNNSYGVSGSSTSSIGPNYGVLGKATNPSTGDNYGIYGRASNTGAGDAWAGYFVGDGYFSGNLGIGTESPSSKLDIGSTSDTANSIRIASSGQASIVFYDADSTACGGMEYFHSNDSLYFTTRDPGDTSSTIKMAIQSDGNVGIGEEYPLSKLQVEGRVHSTIGGFKFPDGTTQTTASNTDGHSLDAADGSPTDAVYVNNDGMVGIGNQDPYFRLDVGETTDAVNYLRIGSQNWGGVSFYDGEDLASGGIKYDHTNDTLDFDTRDPGGSSTTKLSIRSNGNVGIGTVNPTSELEVAGTIEAENIGIGTASPETVLHIKNKSTTEHFQLKIANPYAAGANAGHAGILFHVEDDQPGRGKGGILYQNAGSYNRGHMHFLQNSAGDESQASLSDSVMVIRNNGNVGIGTTDPGSYKLYVNGTAYSTGGWNTSDSRYKQNVETIDAPLEKVMSIDGVSFEWKTSDFQDKGFPEGRHYGVIAQDIEQTLPEVVKAGPQGDKAVSYIEIVPILVEAVKEQQKQIEALQAEISRLNEKLENY